MKYTLACPTAPKKERFALSLMGLITGPPSNFRLDYHHESLSMFWTIALTVRDTMISQHILKTGER